MLDRLPIQGKESLYVLAHLTKLNLLPPPLFSPLLCFFQNPLHQIATHHFWHPRPSILNSNLTLKIFFLKVKYVLNSFNRSLPFPCGYFGRNDPKQPQSSHGQPRRKRMMRNILSKASKYDA